MATNTMSTGTILELDKGKQIPLYAKRDIALVRGEGVYLYDADGTRYLDAMSNYGVAVLGHAHPRFTAAMADQLQTLTTCHQSFANDIRAELLAELDTIAPAGLTRSFLSNSGTEAIEAALKFARASTGRTRIVAARRGYHGRTFGALSATADKKYRAPFEPLPIPAEHIAFNDADALEAAVDRETAAIILEPIQGEGGIHPADDTFLKRAREIATATGAVLITDEIQSGFRTGDVWAASACGVVPDIAVTAKALANGLPIGLTMVTEAISEQMPGGAHGSTFGGNPLVARGALETLRILREDDLYARAKTTGARLIESINALESPKVRAVRGRGLMIGIELKQKATPVLRGLQENGVLALMAGTLVIRVLPPMTWEEEHADQFVETFARVLEMA
jgi:LysW-gamma-L-lysine/LysW-L-ornithine aminotransferase